MADTVETPSATDQRNDPIVQDSGNAPVPENADVTESLFGETVTDAELMGEEPGTDTPEEPTDAPEPSTLRSRAAPEEGSTKPDDAEPHPTTPGDASEEAETVGAVKPPPGYVPLAALHEERGKRQAMASRLQELEAAVAALSEQKPAEGTQDTPRNRRGRKGRDTARLQDIDIPGIPGPGRERPRGGADLPPQLEPVSKGAGTEPEGRAAEKGSRRTDEDPDPAALQ